MSPFPPAISTPFDSRNRFRLQDSHTLNILTGAITGVSTQTGTFDAIFRLSDSLGGQTQKSFTLTIK
jgi:hypothetical protein